MGTAAHSTTLKPTKQLEYHELKNENANFNLKWEIIGQAKLFNPVTGICALCTREKFLIAFAPEGATLNKRSELYASCRHKEGKLLIPKEKKKRKPG